MDLVGWPDNHPPARRHTGLSSRPPPAVQAPATLGSRLRDGGFDVQQQRFHVACPVLLLLFVQEGQLAQMMHVTERMSEITVLLTTLRSLIMIS